MNYKLAKEIYGIPWFVDPVSFMQLSKALEGQQQETITVAESEKANCFNVLTKANAYNAFSISRMEEVPKDSIAIYYFDSVITKNGGMSHFGTKEIAAQFTKMEADDNIIGHLYHIESGGGSANAVKYIREVAAKSVRKKPLVVYAEDLMASAAMYIGSDADYIFAKSDDALIGSIGTMVAFEGHKAGTEDKTGKRHIRIYSTQSFNKNKEYEDAINDFNYEPIQKKILDPHSETFIKDMEENRPNIRKEEKTGAIFHAHEVVGTLIDEIGSFDDAIEKITELHNNNNNLNSKNMTNEELKNQHPVLFAEIHGLGKQEGIETEKARVDTWNVFSEIDSKKVKAGINSGKPMSEAEKLEFLMLSQKTDMQRSLEDASTGDVNADLETGKIKPKTNIEEKAANVALDELLGKKEEEQ